MKINGIDALYYSAKDFARARMFYTRMIGAEPSALYEEFCEWTLPNGEAFGVIKGEHYRPGSGVLFNVDNVRASIAELRAADVIFDDDGAIEETPVCYMAFGTDTEGNTFILHQRK